MLRLKLVLSLILFAHVPAMAQSYPSKPVHIIIGTPAGGPSDVMARFLAQELSASFGPRFVVENRPGANGALAGDVVAKADRDGYTIMLCSASVMTITPHMNSNLRWDPLKDFTPIVYIGTTPLAIGVPKASSINSLSDLLAAARKEPGAINFAVQTGSMPHIAGKMLESGGGVQMTLVPFRGGGQMHAAVLANEVHVIIDGITPLIPHFQSGALTPMAVTGDSRVDVLPNTPTVGELIPGFEAGSWFALFGPAGLEPAVVKLMNEAVNKIIAKPDIRARLVQMAIAPVGGEPDRLRQRLQVDFEKFGAVIKRAGIKLE
jgi:tripartite-type tricarboxylate transporter receptor subunit TctC